MKLQELHEGIFDFLKKKSLPKENTPLEEITPEERAFIKRHFANSNVDIKFGDGRYVLPHNVSAHHGKGIIWFIKRNGKLEASVAYHASAADAGNPKAVPLLHFELKDISDAALEKLKSQLDEGWKSKAGAVALAAATATGIALSPKLTIDGVTYDKAISAPPPDAKIVTKDGKKYKVWQGTYLKQRPGGNKYNLYQQIDEHFSKSNV